MSLFFSAIPYLLAGGTVALACFTLVKEWEEYKDARLRRGVLIVLIAVGVLTFVSLYRDSKDKEKERNQAASDIEGLKGQVKAASDAQERNTQEFLKSFKDMTDQVATLQTEVKTEALQKKLASLQADLQKNEKAMAPGPKAELVFTFAPVPVVHEGTAETFKDLFKPISEVTLPLNQDGSVHVEFTVVNVTTVDAFNLGLTIEICPGCKFAKEPPGLAKLPGQSETERFLFVPTLHGAEGYRLLGLDIIPPPGLAAFEVGCTYRCNPCKLSEEYVKGTIHIAGR